MASLTGITTRPYNHLTLPSSSPSHLCHQTTTSLITLPTPLPFPLPHPLTIPVHENITTPMASPTGITTRPYNRLTPPSSSPSHLCHPKTTSLIILPTPSTITTPSPTNDASTRNYHHTYGISNRQYYKTLQPLDTTIILTITPPSPNNDISNNATNTFYHHHSLTHQRYQYTKLSPHHYLSFSPTHGISNNTTTT